MAMMIPTATQYEFTSIENVLDFIKPLLVEGYKISTETVFQEFPREYLVEKFVIYVIDKDKKMKLTVVDPEGENNE